MIVLDHEPNGWFLVADGVRLLLDVNCSHGAISYQFLMELNESERATYQLCGHKYISELATKIQDSAPGVAGNASPYQDRVLRGTDQSMVDEVTIAWVKAHGGTF